MEKNNYKYPEYTVVIRTLGTAGNKFQQEIKSLECQTILPSQILVYIAEGYSLPPRVGNEQYIYCPKGMVTQRSLPFEEVATEYILFLDDDVYLPPRAVEDLFAGLLENNGDCITPNVFLNHQASLISKLKSAWSMQSLPHYDSRYAFKIRKSSAYSYNHHPLRAVYESQAGAFACALIRKEVYKALHFENERWLEQVHYAWGDDLLFFYKIYLLGYKLLVHYETGILHLDAKSGNSINQSQVYYTFGKSRLLLWWRCQYSLATGLFTKIRLIFAYVISVLISISYILCVSLLKLRLRYLLYYVKGIISASKFISSAEASRLPLFIEK